MSVRLFVSCLLVAASSAASAAPICHVKGNGDEIQIDVNTNALSAHYDHGDEAPVTLYEDSDGDGLGNPDSDIQSCDESVDGYVDNADDADDQNPNTCDVNLGYTPPNETIAAAGFEATTDVSYWGVNLYDIYTNLSFTLQADGQWAADLEMAAFGIRYQGLGQLGGADSTCDERTMVFEGTYVETTTQTVPMTMTFVFNEDGSAFTLTIAVELSDGTVDTLEATSWGQDGTCDNLYFNAYYPELCD